MIKKVIISIFILLSLNCSLFLPGAYSVDFSVGAYTFLAWWQPAWRNHVDNFQSDPLFMWGPNASMTVFDDFTLSLLYLSNSLNQADASFESGGTGTHGDFTLEFDTKIDRQDADFSITYRINSNFRIFVGYKMMEYTEGGGGGETDADITIIGSASYTLNTIDAMFSSCSGPGAGVSFILPLSDAFYLNLGTSLVIMETELEVFSFSDWGGGNIGGDTSNGKYRAYGNNSSAGLIYYNPDIDITAAIGWRGQFLKYQPLDGAEKLENDIFQGMYANISYLF